VDDTLEQVLMDDVSPEILVNGKPLDRSPKPCGHRTFGVDSLSALINDAEGNLVSREVRIRVRCMECGVPCVVNLDARRPRNGEQHGVVFTITPMEDE